MIDKEWGGATHTGWKAIPIKFLRHYAQLGITTEEAREQERRTIPIGRNIEPEDIAHLALFLCSQQASAITGQSIAVDGGAETAIAY